MKKVLLSKEEIQELEENEMYDIEINPRKESEECGCDYCMSEWEIVKENPIENKEGFTLGQLINET